MENFTDLAVWPLWIPLVSLGIILGLEYWIPFRATRQSKFHHVSTNLTIAGINSVMVRFVFGGLYIAWTQQNSGYAWGLLHILGFGPTGNLLTSLFLLDLMGYGIHWVHHRVPILWRFHRAHHSDLDLDATTALRFHVGEAFITGGIRAVSLPILGVSWVSLVAYEIAFQALGLFSHSNIRFPESIDRRVRCVFVSPEMHWLHHSRRPVEHNANFGQIFSIWDHLLATYRTPIERSRIEIGLDDYPSPDQVSIVPFFSIPLRAPCRPDPSPAVREPAVGR